MSEKKFTAELPHDLGGEYTILSELKSDKRGQVLLVYDAVCRRKAILKVSDGAPGPIEADAAAASALAGGGIPAVYCCRSAENSAWLLREYIAGDTLDEYVKKKGGLGTDEVVSLGIAVCRVIGRMHSHEPQMIHRDIKPQNIVRTKVGTLYLIDLGTCREYDASASFDTQIIGTPASAPPEQFGYRQTDTRSDVYSIGVLLNFLSTGEYSLDKRSASPRLKPVIEKCTSFAPDDRYSDAMELQRALEALLPSARLRKRILICAAAIAAAAAVIFVPNIVRGISPAVSGISSENGAYRFADPTIEAEVCRQLGKDNVSADDLNGITELLLVGKTSFDDWYSLTAIGSRIAVDGVGIDDRSGIFSLEDIAAMPNLHTLSLCNGEISDLSPLAGSKIKRLALYGNNISDITPLSQCALLSELFIGNNPVSVISPLLECRQLSVLNVGMTRVSNFEVLSKLPELSALNIVMCDHLTDLSPPAEMDGLRELTVFHADEETLELICGMIWLVKFEIWCSADVADFGGIARLQNLKHLLFSMLDDNALSSLDGIEKLPRLYYLFVGTAKGTDISALGGSRSLIRITFEGCEIDDYSALTEMSGLKNVECSGADSGKISALFADNEEVTVTII